MTRVVLVLIRGYQLTVSPLLGALEDGEEENHDEADHHPQGEVFVDLVHVKEIITPAVL